MYKLNVDNFNFCVWIYSHYSQEPFSSLTSSCCFSLVYHSSFLRCHLDSTAVWDQSGAGNLCRFLEVSQRNGCDRTPFFKHICIGVERGRMEPNTGLDGNRKTLKSILLCSTFHYSLVAISYKYLILSPFHHYYSGEKVII